MRVWTRSLLMVLIAGWLAQPIVIAQAPHLPSSLAADYQVVPLVGPSNQPHVETHALNLNDLGDVVGYTLASSPFDLVPRLSTAAMWMVNAESLTPPRAVILRDLGGSQNYANAINNSRQIVGDAYTAAGKRRAVYWATPFSQPIDLGDFGGGESHAADITDNGIVVGYARDTNGSTRAFRWTAQTGMTELAGSTGCMATAASERNRIVGVCNPGSPASAAVIWNEDGNVFWMGAGGALGMTHVGLDQSNPEWIVGQSEGDHPRPRSFFPYLDLMPYEGTANGVNRLRQAAGWFFTGVGNTHAYVYNGGFGNDLNGLIRLNSEGQVLDGPYTDSEFLYDRWVEFYWARKINDQGAAVGDGLHGYYPETSPRLIAFLLRGNWCTYELTTSLAAPSRPEYMIPPPDEGSAVLNVTPHGIVGASGCAWTVKHLETADGVGSPWLGVAVSQEAPAEGEGTVALSYDVNDTATWRFGQVEVAGHHVWVAQTAGYVDVSDVRVSDDTPTSAGFRITLSRVLADPVRVQFQTTGGSATANVDYQPVSSSVLIPAGSSQAVASVPIMADSGPEPEETFGLTITSVSGPVTVRRANATGVINASVKIATTSALASSANPASYGQPFQLSLSVSPQPTGVAAPTGDAQFFDGSELLGTIHLIDGAASLRVNGLPAGTHSLTATYSGDINYIGSASPALVQAVNGITSSSSTTIAADPSPSTIGIVTKLTAKVFTAGPATGRVDFYDGVTALGSAPVLSGKATLAASFLSSGGRLISARYSGDHTYAGSDSLPVVLTVSLGGHLAKSSVSATVSPNPAALGSAPRIDVTVSAPGKIPPSGTALLVIDGITSDVRTLQPAGKVSTASFAPKDLSRGSHVVLVAYMGNSDTAGNASAPVLVSVP